MYRSPEGEPEFPVEPGSDSLMDILNQDVAKVVQEKYIARSSGDINFNMIVLAGEEQD